MAREAGILLPVTSLPGPYGIGCFSRYAYAFIDYLRDAGQSYWQILPLGPTSYGDSPYQSFSTFAGNPYFIDLESLVGEGVLTAAECDAADFGSDPTRVDYSLQHRFRYPLLRKAFSHSRIIEEPSYQRFLEQNRQWLPDYALFMALKSHFGGKSWLEWPDAVRFRDPDALRHYRMELREEIDFQQYLQFKFFMQWSDLRAYANDRGIRIIGDIPIYVAMDSADVWANPELFQLDDRDIPVAVAGCPPDGFSADGQLWGNPLYRWDYHRETGFAWWMSRLDYCFRLYDVLRIDHFRGFDEYFSIPYGEKTAIGGHWEKGPGLELFETMRRCLGDREVIAEDLGYVTDSVRRLVRDTGFPGMKVLEFAFDSRDSGSANDYLPHNYPENCVVYTGTHDNETVAGWLTSITQDELRMLREYLCDFYTPDQELRLPFVSLALASCARMCVIPLQDYLGYDNSCRINQPSTVGSNWQWRVTEAELSQTLQASIHAAAVRYGRKH
ncbi:MAG: 4-alpha-glucanotransferase [Oscillospiraceae bacterium]|nr:4-alpha-glucanotransferase [Oscillospiraceae bacterium]